MENQENDLMAHIRQMCEEASNGECHFAEFEDAPAGDCFVDEDAHAEACGPHCGPETYHDPDAIRENEEISSLFESIAVCLRSVLYYRYGIDPAYH